MWLFARCDVTFPFKLLLSAYAPVRALPRPARVGVSLFFLAGLADGVLMPFFALWAQREAGVPTEYIGLLLGCYAGGELLATPLLGGIADRIGRRPTLLAATAGVGAGFLLLFLTHGVLAAAAALIVIGSFESVLHPTAAAIIADVTPAEGLRRQFALTHAASNAGRMTGPALGALLVQWSLGLVFVGSAAAMLIGTAAVAFALPETRAPAIRPDQDGGDDDDDIAALATAFRDRRLAALLLPMALLGVASSWIEAVMPLHAAAAETLPPAGIGLLFTYAGALCVLFQLPVTQAFARTSAFAVVAASGAALALAFASLLISPALPHLILAVSLLALSEMLSGPLVQTLVTALAPAGARATYMAALSAANDLKDTAGPAVGIALFAVAAALPWLAGLPIALAAAMALAVAARRHEARRE
jgi:MFS family permease